MKNERWLRIIPVALIMYTISYVDRTNITLALEPKISSMMHDLLMDDRLKGQAAGIFFIGYVLLQVPGGFLANHWSAKRFVSICLVLWGACAVGCGLAKTFTQFEVMRFLLGMAESGVLPATTVLLANWFPRAERARANGYWNLCQPIAIVVSAPITSLLLGTFGWQKMLIIEGCLPFIWLPIWLYFVSDHPRQAKWISPEERDHLEATLKKEVADLHSTGATPLWMRWEILVMVVIYFLHNCQAYGCMTFFTASLKARNFSPFEYGILLAAPYVLTAIIMVVVSHNSDRTQERRGHVAFVYAMSGVSLILSILLKDYSFWLSYIFLCLAIPGPFAAIAPFWAITGETMPRPMMGLVIGIVNGVGNVGGYAGPYLTGWLKEISGNTNLPFALLGIGMFTASGLCFLLPKAAPQKINSPTPLPAADAHA